MNFFGLGTAELILILVVLLLFFGKDRLPELARSIGKSFRELRSGLDVNAEDPKTENKAETEKVNQTTDKKRHG